MPPGSSRRSFTSYLALDVEEVGEPPPGQAGGHPSDISCSFSRLKVNLRRDEPGGIPTPNCRPIGLRKILPTHLISHGQRPQRPRRTMKKTTVVASQTHAERLIFPSRRGATLYQTARMKATMTIGGVGEIPIMPPILPARVAKSLASVTGLIRLRQQVVERPQPGRDSRGPSGRHPHFPRPPARVEVGDVEIALRSGSRAQPVGPRFFERTLRDSATISP